MTTSRVQDFLAQARPPEVRAIRPRVLQRSAWMIVLAVLFNICAGVTGPNAPALAGLCLLAGTILMLCALLLPVLFDSLRGRRQADDRAWFAVLLADLLDMGIPLPEALDRVTTEMMSHPLHRMSIVAQGLQHVTACVRAGGTLTYGLSSSGAFPTYWAGLVYGGEQALNLPAALRRLAAIDAREPVLAPESVGRAALSLLVVITLAGSLSNYILPTFMSLFEAMHVPLPYLTRTVVMALHGWILPLSSLLMLGLTLYLVATLLAPGLVRQVGLRFFNACGAYRLYKQQQQALTSATLVAALESGLSVPEALAIAASSAYHPLYRKALERMATASGDRLSALLATEPQCFDRALVWLVAQGEQYGNLAEVLTLAAQRLSEGEETLRANLRTLLDTGLVVLTGSVVGVVVFALMQPVFGLISAIGGSLTP
jgi:type II secretory pathway component PulF